MGCRVTRRYVLGNRFDRVVSCNTTLIDLLSDQTKLDQLHGTPLHVIVDIDVALGHGDTLVTGKAG